LLNASGKEKGKAPKQRSALPAIARERINNCRKDCVVLSPVQLPCDVAPNVKTSMTSRHKVKTVIFIELPINSTSHSMWRLMHKCFKRLERFKVENLEKLRRRLRSEKCSVRALLVSAATPFRNVPRSVLLLKKTAA
jgi:hypothetical protein